MHSMYIHKHLRPPRNLRYTCQALVHRLVAASKMDLILKALKESIQLAIKINQVVDKIRFGDDLRCKISQWIQEIQSLLDNLVRYSDLNVIGQIKGTIYNTREQLQGCWLKCNELSEQKKSFKQSKNKEYNVECQKLLSELGHIRDNLKGHSICTISDQVAALDPRVKQVSRNPKTRGKFGFSRCTKKPPYKVDKPEVEMRGVQIHIEWKDNWNIPLDLDKYDICIDGYPLIANKEPERKMALIEPERLKLVPGMLYTFTVRAVNDKGPGEWSDPTTMRLKTGRLDMPTKPNVIISTENVKMEVDIPRTYGRHVNKVVCQYHEYDDGGQWHSESFLTEEVEGPTSMTFVMEKCRPFTHYHFRVILVNECGESPPSDTVDVLPVPGKPTNVRQSSNYTSSMIKLRWKPPEKYSGLVDHYQIKYKRKKHLSKDKPFYVFETKSKDKLSAKIDELKSDTEYVFYLSAVNEKGVSGQAERLIAKTRWKKLTKAALSPFVFLGTTVAGPVLGAVGGGMLAVESIDSKAGAVAGGVGAGIGGALLCTVGAPFVGGTMAHYFVHGLGPDSEQSDDD